MTCPPPILVGEAPSSTSDPSRPFSGRSGARLAALLGRELDSVFELVNLLPAYPGRAGKGSGFDRELARARAAEIAATRGDRLLILVGHRVAAAFGLDGDYLVERDGAIVFPHPSGINRFWNDPANVTRARRVLRSAAARTKSA